ncbi:hypothetical protein ACTQ07_04740 [Holdemanella porci]|uniref:hypothetical protein n=1 Tax=Holdemanella porci TaxID=2652276 RepID=UPI003F90F645
MRIRIVKCIALIISAGVLIYSIITTYGDVVSVVGVLLLVLILGKLYQTIEGMHVLKIRDELNEEFRKAGSPCYYECEYLDWHYVEEYDLIPSEETIKFMREKQQKFREYIATGGDPKMIKNIYDIK